MSRQSVIVVDDFYPDPDAIRELALSLPFQEKLGATYPGLEAIANRDWSDVRAQLQSFIDEPCDAPCPKTPPFPQGKFRLALRKDQDTRPDRCHVDTQRWSGVIYLTRPEDCEEGLILYKHKATGLVTWDDDWFNQHYGWVYSLPSLQRREEILKFFADPDQFEQIGVIPMAYNRAILLMAQVFHGTGRVFGDTPRHARLSQHFEFYAS